MKVYIYSEIVEAGIVYSVYKWEYIDSQTD